MLTVNAFIIKIRLPILVVVFAALSCNSRDSFIPCEYCAVALELTVDCNVCYFDRAVGWVDILTKYTNCTAKAELVRVYGHGVNACICDLQGDDIDLVLHNFHEANQEVDSD